MFRFAELALFEPCRFFGPRADLGQFERFKLQFGTTRFAPLRGLASWRVVAAFDWEAEGGGARAMRRVAVTPPRRGGRGGGDGAGGEGNAPEILYDFTLGQRVGGPADGCWFTLSLTRVECGDGGGGWSPQAPEV